MVFFPAFVRNLQKAIARMEKLEKGLEDVDRRVEEYKNKFQKLNEEATKLKIKLEKEQETIASAENLIGKLDGEYERWSAQVKSIFNMSIKIPQFKKNLFEIFNFQQFCFCFDFTL